jgi:hypothetical protein
MKKTLINKIILALAFLLMGINASSQSTIKGSIQSEIEAIPFGTMLLSTATDSSIVKVSICDSLGAFIFQAIPNGEYFISGSMVGFQDYFSETITVNGADIDLGKILMTNDEMMDAVTVLKIRPIIEVKPDMVVFNVDQTVNSTGANGFELLRKAPGVMIDNNNNVVLEGKSGVQIYIDHKASVLAGDDLINFLKSLQASDIDKIEIITQPSSKYDAAGNAGIINIILKRDKSLGTNGTISAGYDYGVNSRANSSLSLNHRSKKFNIYSAYSNNFGKRWNGMHFERTQSGYQFDSETNMTNNVTSHNGRIGADWFINPKHTIGILASGNFFDTDSESSTTTDIRPVAATIADQILIAENSSVGQNYQYAGNFNYRFADTLGHELIIDGDYGVYSRDANSYQPNEYYSGSDVDNIQYENNFRMITPTNIEIITGKVDYSQYLWKGKLSIGAKYSLVNTDNTFEFYDEVAGEDVLDPNRSNVFDYSENINAAYFNYGKKIGYKWNFQLGLRVENTISEGNLTSTQVTTDTSVSRNYTNFFPSGGITWTPNRNHIWSLTTSRRIQRPNYQVLNPFVSQLDELSYRQGNPFLQAQYSNNVKVSHTYKYRFSTSLGYSYTQGYFAQVTDTLSATQHSISTKNVADESVINMGLTLPFSVKKWWNVFLSLNGTYTSYIAKDPNFTPIERLTGSMFGQNTFILPKGFKLEISGWFSTPSIWGGTYKTKSMGSLDIAVEKKFLGDRLTARVAASDILYTSPWRADMTYGTLYIKGGGGWESRKIAVSLSYNFGSKEVKGSRKRTTGLEDEEKRTGGE